MERGEQANGGQSGLNVPMMLLLGVLGAGVGVGLSFLMRHFGAG